MGKPVDEQVSDLIRQIERRYRSLNRKRLISHVLIPVGVLLLGSGLFIWLEQQFYFSSASKIILGCLFLAVGIGITFWIRRASQPISLSDFYSSISEDIRQPSLRHALDLSLKSRDRDLKLYRSAVKKNVESVPWRKIQPKIDRQIKELPSSRFFRKVVSGLVLSVFLFTASAFVHPDAFMRTAQFWNDFQKPNPYSFTITPGNTTIEQGGTFEPSIQFDGKAPNELLLGIKTEVENNFRFRPLQETSDGKYTATPTQLNSNSSYFVQMGEFRSDEYRVNVQLRPRFESLSVEVFPPSYTGLDSTTFTYPFSQVQAYRGSERNRKKTWRSSASGSMSFVARQTC